VLKPGGHMAVFGGCRTHHRLMVALENAGFEIRDMLIWMFGSGFPKSHSVSKNIDKTLGCEREIVGEVLRWGNNAGHGRGGQYANGYEATVAGATRIDYITAPASDEAKRFDGFGTGLKPSYEPIILVRKPLSETSVAKNVLKWGTGALNIDAARIPTTDKLSGGRNGAAAGGYGGNWNATAVPQADARWPANVLHDGSGDVIQGLGAASRYFYSAKASKADRAGSKHPTVKPVNLMRYLCKLITPPGGLILDPFAGSGTTGQAALEEGFNAILIEREAEYCEDIRRRLGLAA
jgi:hypothetical protein